MSSNITRSESLITAADRKKLTGGGCVVWFSGLSGSGKSTLARRTEQMLYENGILSYILDGDNVRFGLCSDLGFSDKDRQENLRRLAHTAALFEDAGLVCLVCAISPFEESRRYAASAAKSFISVYVKASADACAKRDVKGLYAKAQRGEIQNFTGISSPFEIPESPDVILDTENEDAEACAKKLYNTIVIRLQNGTS